MSSDSFFFVVNESVSLGDLASACDCELKNPKDASKKIDSVGPIESAGSGSLTFLGNPRYVDELSTTRASAVICSEQHASRVTGDVSVLVSSDPYMSFALAMRKLYKSGLRPLVVTGETGISSSAYIHPTAKIEDSVIIEAGSVIGSDVEIGTGTIIGPNVVIGCGVRIGRDVSIASTASVIHSIIGDRVIIHGGVRLGDDGFGFSMGSSGHTKIPQVGRVIIQDDVEIGANSTIDRGMNRDTIIGEGTKIDNLVMIGHNVVVGRHCVLVAQSGIAGSSTLEDFVVLGGRSVVNGHVRIGMGAQLSGLSAVFDDVPSGVRWGGIPARPIRHWLREVGKARRDASSKNLEK